jgi:hypothetical protein
MTKAGRRPERDGRLPSFPESQKSSLLPPCIALLTTSDNLNP